MTPEKIGRYRIESELGRGAMGQVFLAHDPNIGRRLAIKTIPLDTGNAEMRGRFQREAQAAGRLAHPNIVTIYDAGEENGILYIAMELVDGVSLADVLDGGPLSAEQTISVGTQIASGLAHAHQQSIVHRDIKPANIMVTGSVAKIMDFGVARLASAGLTATGQVLGTPAYLAPEMIQGQPADARADVFSLGVVLYECLTGVRPFDGESISAVMFKVLTERPAEPHLAIPAVPVALSAVVMKAMEKLPAERYQSCEDLAMALKACGAELFSAASAPLIARGPTKPASEPASSFRVSTVMDAAVMDAAGVAGAPSTASTATLPLREPEAPRTATSTGRHTSPTSVIMAVAAMLLISVGYFWWQRGGTGRTPSGIAGESSGGASTETVNAQPAPPPPKPATGTLNVESTPPGARISMNGSATGKVTPASIELRPGNHNIRLEAEGFNGQDREITIDAGENFTLHINLQKRSLLRRINPF